MQITRQFAVARPRAEVWNLFQDVPRVAACIPGTRILEDSGDGKYRGRVEAKLGPIRTAFEGDATHEPNPAEWCGTIAGTGRDRSAGSRAKFSTRYSLRETADGTEVIVESDIALSGPVAQFGRTGLIEEFTSRLIEQFAQNLETALGGPAAGADPGADAAQATPAAATGAPQPADMGALLRSSLWAWLRSLIARLFRRGGKEGA